jgi:ubiquinone biosynthesis monooxygenase Coq7
MTHITPAEVSRLGSAIAGLIGDLRSDHAGETGAVMIYRGILAGTRDEAIRAFATAHMATEQEHIELIEALLPADQRSVLLPLWRVMGFLTGYLPALAGSQAVYATIEAVETFVDHHYEAQIRKLPGHGPGGALRALLIQCQADEVHHRDEAHAAQATPPSPLLRAWAWIVGSGSAAAVHAARRI